MTTSTFRRADQAADLLDLTLGGALRAAAIRPTQLRSSRRRPVPRSGGR